MFSESCRNEVYWLIDRLKGSPVKEQYLQINNIMENGGRVGPSPDEILSYAVRNVAYYKPYSGFSSLCDFPVINKSIIKDHYPEFLSQEYVDKKTIKIYTSGSTGMPFCIEHDKGKRDRCLAEMMYFWGKAGYRLGQKYLYFRNWVSLNKKSKLSAFARNLIMFDVLRFDSSHLESIRHTLKNDRSIKMLIGYASTFIVLADYLTSCGDNPSLFGVRTIIAISEELPETAKNKLKALFGCVVVSHYSNGENGVLAQECNANKEFHVNTASFVVELLDFNKDERVKIGEPGRIVVTDLFNRATPFIRYDTGDIGIQKQTSECNWNTMVLSSIQGRRTDYVYDTSGRMLSPHAITNYMWKYDGLKQFQFIQEDKERYVLKLNGAEGIYTDAEFIAELKIILGADAKIVLEHVNGIPLLSSGKFKYIICRFDPQK